MACYSWWPRWRYRLPILLGLIAVLTSCSAMPMPPSIAKAEVVTVTMAEYRFDYQGRIPSGRVIITTKNAGNVIHELVLARLSGATPGPTPGSAPQPEVVHPLGYIHPRDPGATGIFAVDLAPGRYLFVCYVLDADGIQHHQKGMRREFVSD